MEYCFAWDQNNRLVDTDRLVEEINAYKPEDMLGERASRDEIIGFGMAQSAIIHKVLSAPTVDAIPVEWFIRMNLSCGMQGEIGAVAALNWVLGQWKMTKGEWDNGLEAKK